MKYGAHNEIIVDSDHVISVLCIQLMMILNEVRTITSNSADHRGLAAEVSHFL